LLFGERADDFLNWFAHIEQKPGELPHTAWLHVASNLGLGRNWLGSLASRLWPDEVAGSFDLIGNLDGGFNGTLAHKRLILVDEIREGGSDSHRHMQRLKSIITEETRVINPKYGRQTVEYNCARWLMFSNHRSAIPLDENDRRFEVVVSDAPPEDSYYYQHLYHLLHNRNFIYSVLTYLKQRDISAFNPGERAKLTTSKLNVIRSSSSDFANDLRAFLSSYDKPLMTNEMVKHLLGGDAVDLVRVKVLVKRTMEDFGWVRMTQRPRAYGRQQVLWVKADQYEVWDSPEAVVAEGLPSADEYAAIVGFGGI